MTTKEKIEYLKQYKYLNRHIDRLLEEKEMWKARAEKVTSTVSDMPHGSDGENQRELAICKMADCERVVTGMIDDYVDLGNEIKALINTVKEENLKLLLLYRYIDCKTWEQIAVNMDYTFQWVHHLHGVALEKIIRTVDSN